MAGSPVPPAARSRTALGLLLGVAAGGLLLQRCGECGTVQYPPREACVSCLGADLPWTGVDAGGYVLASTLVRVSNDRFFRDRAPWRVGSVQADCGPRVLAHLADGLESGDRVWLAPKVDPGGRPVLVALAADSGRAMPDSGELSMFRDDVEGRTVRVTDTESSLGRAVVEALHASGAGEIVSGGAGPGECASSDPAEVVLDTRP